MPPSPTLPTIRANAVTVIKGVLNVGAPSTVNTVHGRKRWWRDQQKFEQLFVRGDTGALKGYVNGWMVYRERTRVVEADERWRFYEIHRMKAEGFFGMLDLKSGATAEDFEDQVEAIRDAFRLNTTVFSNSERTVPDVEVEIANEVILIGQATVWHAVLGFDAEGIEVKTA